MLIYLTAVSLFAVSSAFESVFVILVLSCLFIPHFYQSQDCTHIILLLWFNRLQKILMMPLIRTPTCFSCGNGWKVELNNSVALAGLVSAVVCGGGGGVVVNQLSRTHEHSWPWALFAHLTQTLSEPCLAASQPSSFVAALLSIAPMLQRLFYDSATVFNCPWNYQQVHWTQGPRFTLPISVSTLVAASAHVAHSQPHWLVKVYSNNREPSDLHLLLLLLTCCISMAPTIPQNLNMAIKTNLLMETAQLERTQISLKVFFVVFATFKRQLVWCVGTQDKKEWCIAIRQEEIKGFYK